MPRPLRFLEPGDTIALVSPAGPIKDLDLQPAISWLEEEGYRVRVMPHARGRWRYLAATDDGRTADLMAAFGDPDVRAVLATRGGYGCARILPLLDLDAIADSGKLFLGFSDLTTLHLALNRRGMPTFHAPMCSHIAKWMEEWPAESLRRVLRGDFTSPDGIPRGTTVVPGTATAPVGGGCLSLLGDSLGTADAFLGRDRIVLIEDIHEEPYRVDARLTHLRNSGALDGVAGLVVGEMTGTDDKVEVGCEGCTWREIVRERLEPLGVPMIWDYPFGHIVNSRTLPLNRAARLDADAGTLDYL